MTRQREWQLRKVAKGLCTSCGNKALDGNERCFRHYVLRQFIRVGLKPQGRAHVYNREYVLAWLRSVYVAAMSFPEKSEVEQPRIDRVWGKHAFNRSATGAERFTRVVRAVERLAGKKERP